MKNIKLCNIDKNNGIIKVANTPKLRIGNLKMEKDNFTKSPVTHLINYVINTDEYEGISSFFLPNKTKTVMVRHYINDSENPPVYKQNTPVKGEFLADIDSISKTNVQNESKIIQNDSYQSEIIGTITKIEENGDAVLFAEGINIGISLENPKNFKIGDSVTVKGNLEFLFDD